MNTHFLLPEVASRYFLRCGRLAAFSFIAFALLALPQHLRAVVTSGTYNTTEPTDADVPNWTTGWGAGGITGWNYVGTVNGDSGVYLGNGWVLTAAHVGAGNFTLGSTTYALSGSAVEVASGVDLTLFRIATSPTLPSLTLDTTLLYPSFSKVVMIGYGGSHGETWGYNTVSAINQSTPVTSGGKNYTSEDFVTDYGAQESGFYPYTNNATFIGGDSGGGDFVNVGGTWELAGINEAVSNVSGTGDSYMVQVSSYSTQINTITAKSVPEPSALAMVAVSGILLGGIALLRRRRCL